MSDTLSLPVLPLDDTVVLPTMVVPVDTSGTEARAAIEAAQISAGADGAAKATPQVLLVPRVNGKYSSVGTLGAVEQIGRLPSGEPAAAIRGLSRVRIGSGTVGPGAALWIEGSVEEEPPASARARERAREYRALAATILQKRGAWQVVDVLQRITDPSALADSAGYANYLTLEQRQELLETIDPQARLERLTGWARDQNPELGVPRAVQDDVRAGREEQAAGPLIEAAALPEKVAEAALKEAEKLERSSDASPEAGWIRTWLDTVLEIPWNERTDDAYDIEGARAILDADHAGLDDVKDRIIEYLAVRKRRSDN